MMDEKTLLCRDTIEKLRPYLQRDGGDLVFVKFEDGKLYVQLTGACIGCTAMDLTFDGITDFVADELTFVKQVVFLNDATSNYYGY